MVICAVAALLAIALTRPAAAQTPTQVAKLFASAADVTALIDRAKRERKPDQPNFVQPIVLLQPYSVNLEYRVGGLNAPASIHEKDAELFLVLEGAGTVVTGGKLKDERRTNPANLTGTAIEGGSSRRLAKGDWVLVPENTAHWFTQVDGTLVMMSLHVPHP
jgi:mannose-6-phosphate isomerase-like protein (cupin superfamily)